MATAEAGTFGALLRRSRQAAALSQEGLAERAGLSAGAISALERGMRRAPHLTTVEMLATALALGAADHAALVAAARPERAAPFAADDLVPLVGRQRELAVLDHFLAGTRELLGSAPVLLLAGEPGMGKTRLLQAAVQLAIPRGWCVLAGGCQRRGGQDPHAPLLEALARHLQALGAAQRRTALAGCAWLVRLLPELAEALEPLPAAWRPPEQERRLIHAAVARLLTNVAGPAGTLLILDDLHWAGQDALDLITTLVRTAPGPLRLVGAYRDTEVRAADPLGLLLADLAQARLARQQSLGPLDATDAEALLQALLVDAPAGDHGLVERVLQRAGGIPFFLVSYAQAQRQGSAEGVPWDLAQGVRQRLALLPEPAALVLRAAAVLGRRAARALLVAATEQPEEVVVMGLEAACGAGLLREDGDDAYAFAHDVIREVVEAELGAARGAVLHRKVAEALEAAPLGAPPELLAYHFSGAGRLEQAAYYYEQAGDHAWRQRAPGAAEAHHGAALTVLARLGRRQALSGVHGKLGEMLYQTGRYAAAIQALEPAAALLRAAKDWEALGHIVARIGWLHSLAGSAEAGLALVRPVLARLERVGTGAPLAALATTQGQLLIAAGQYAAALTANERAAELARHCGDTLNHVRAEYNRLAVYQILGRFEAAFALGDHVLSLSDAADHPNTLVGALRDLAYMHALRGEFDPAWVCIDRAAVVARQMQDPGPTAYTLAQRGWTMFLRGDLAGGSAALDEAVAIGRAAQRTWYAPYPQIFRAGLYLAEGNWAAALASVQEALRLSDEGVDPQARRRAASVAAELDILQGHAEAARERLASLLDQPGLEECDVTTLLPVLAWAQLELEQVDEAAETVEQALRRARPEEMRLVLVEALRVQALIALRREHWDEAAGSLEEGLALARGMPHPYSEARLLHVYGQMRARQGESEVARERLAAARAIFVQLGARREIERVEQALAALPQKQTVGEPGLTDVQWAQVEAMLPPRQGRGRPRAGSRRTLEAILYVQRTGCAWAELPATLGDEATAHRRWQEWRAAGLWERIVAIVGTTPATLEEPATALRREAAAPARLPRSGAPRAGVTIETDATLLLRQYRLG